jgi:surface antigen
LAGIFTGFGGHYLTRPYGYPTGYYGHSTYPNQPHVTVIQETATSYPAQQVQEMTSCLQQREYQTVVTVGNREVEAYGTACLQPDGSWLRGPAKIAPNY